MGNEKIKFSPKLQPACLPKGEPKWGSKISLSGHGAVTTFIDEFKKYFPERFKKMKRVSRGSKNHKDQWVKRGDWLNYKDMLRLPRKERNVRFMRSVAKRILWDLHLMFPGFGDIAEMLRTGVVPEKNVTRTIKNLLYRIEMNEHYKNNLDYEYTQLAIDRGVRKLAELIVTIRESYPDGKIHELFTAFVDELFDGLDSPLLVEVSSDHLMKMNGTLLNPKTCQKHGNFMKSTWESHTCLDLSNQVFCSGDSGGPITTSKRGMAILVGVVSYNADNQEVFPDLCDCNCNGSHGGKSPDYVTRVDLVTDWIASVLKKHGVNPPSCYL